MSEPLIFKTSEASLRQRRLLLRDLRIVLALVLLLGCLALNGQAWGVQLAAWAFSAGAWFLLWRLKAGSLLRGYASRELRVQDNAIELVQGRFTRLLFFSQLEQLRMIQGDNEKVLAVELRTLDGAVLLQGYENMEALFTAVNSRKPAKVLIEVEEGSIGKTSPDFWRRLVYALGAVLLALAVFLNIN